MSTNGVQGVALLTRRRRRTPRVGQRPGGAEPATRVDGAQDRRTLVVRSGRPIEFGEGVGSVVTIRLIRPIEVRATLHFGALDVRRCRVGRSGLTLDVPPGARLTLAGARPGFKATVDVRVVRRFPAPRRWPSYAAQTRVASWSTSWSGRTRLSGGDEASRAVLSRTVHTILAEVIPPADAWWRAGCFFARTRPETLGDAARWLAAAGMVAQPPNAPPSGQLVLAGNSQRNAVQFPEMKRSLKATFGGVTPRFIPGARVVRSSVVILDLTFADGSRRPSFNPDSVSLLPQPITPTALGDSGFGRGLSDLVFLGIVHATAIAGQIVDNASGLALLPTHEVVGSYGLAQQGPPGDAWEDFATAYAVIMSGGAVEDPIVSQSSDHAILGESRQIAYGPNDPMRPRGATSPFNGVGFVSDSAVYSRECQIISACGNRELLKHASGMNVVAVGGFRQEDGLLGDQFPVSRVTGDGGSGMIFYVEYETRRTMAYWKPDLCAPAGLMSLPTPDEWWSDTAVLAIQMILTDTRADGEYADPMLYESQKAGDSIWLTDNIRLANTSFATPIVASAAAWVRYFAGGTIKPAQLRAILYAGCVGYPSWEQREGEGLPAWADVRTASPRGPSVFGNINFDAVARIMLDRRSLTLLIDWSDLEDSVPRSTGLSTAIELGAVTTTNEVKDKDGEDLPPWSYTTPSDLWVEVARLSIHLPTGSYRLVMTWDVVPVQDDTHAAFADPSGELRAVGLVESPPCLAWLDFPSGTGAATGTYTSFAGAPYRAFDFTTGREGNALVRFLVPLNYEGYLPDIVGFALRRVESDESSRSDWVEGGYQLRNTGESLGKDGWRSEWATFSNRGGEVVLLERATADAHLGPT